MKYYLLFIALFFLTKPVLSQKLAVTIDGDTIEIYSDGTWEPVISKKQEKKIISNVKVTFEEDEFSSSKKLTTERWKNFGKDDLENTITGYIVKVDSFFFLTMYSDADLGCMSEYSSKLIVKLNDGEMIEMAQVGSTDCSDSPIGLFVFADREVYDSGDQEILEKQKENINKLLESNWKAIRLRGSDYYTDFSPTNTTNITNPEEFFKQHISALLNW